MEYVIASLAAILVATLIVYKLVNSIFGLSLRLRPLLLCAACSMLISLVLPKIVVGFAGLPGTIAFLAVFAIIFAYFVAKYENEPACTEGNENESAYCLELAQNQPDTLVPVGFISEMPGEICDSNNGKQEIIHNTESENEHKSDSALVELAVQTNVIEKAHDYGSQDITTIPIIERTEELFIHEQTSLITATISEVIYEDTLYPDLFELKLGSVTDEVASGEVENCLKQAEILADTPNQDNEDIINSLETEEPENLSQALDGTDNLPEETDEVKLISDWTEPDNLVLVTDSANIYEKQAMAEESAELIEEVAEEPENVDPTLSQYTVFEELLEEIEIVQESLDITEQEEELMQKRPDMTLMTSGVTVQEDEDSIMPYNETAVKIILPESDKLDDLVDFAFYSKERQAYEAALTAFRQALALYPYSEAAPFIVVEIGNLLKNKGSYDEAVEVFSNGRNLCQARENEIMEQEFISTIAYLRIIKNILVQHRLGCIPFSEIPQDIAKEIEEEFKEWRSVGNN